MLLSTEARRVGCSARVKLRRPRRNAKGDRARENHFSAGMMLGEGLRFAGLRQREPLCDRDDELPVGDVLRQRAKARCVRVGHHPSDNEAMLFCTGRLPYDAGDGSAGLHLAE